MSLVFIFAVLTGVHTHVINFSKDMTIPQLPPSLLIAIKQRSCDRKLYRRKAPPSRQQQIMLRKSSSKPGTWTKKSSQPKKTHNLDGKSGPVCCTFGGYRENLIDTTINLDNICVACSSDDGKMLREVYVYQSPSFGVPKSSLLYRPIITSFAVSVIILVSIT